ncbi:hypothetical protein ABZ313_02265 [Streptomyces sp. NPDC006251]|uniref:hypothetical protein n=1 Tax=Streptomyces sp. NPDC006251 TaxID=3155718 RepID=UPI0033A18387
MTSNAATPERNPFLEAVGSVTVAGAHLNSALHNLLAQLTFEPTLLVLANAEGTDRLIELCELALGVYDIDMRPEDVTEALPGPSEGRERQAEPQVTKITVAEKLRGGTLPCGMERQRQEDRRDPHP